MDDNDALKELNYADAEIARGLEGVLRFGWSDNEFGPSPFPYISAGITSKKGSGDVYIYRKAQYLGKGLTLFDQCRGWDHLLTDGAILPSVKIKGDFTKLSLSEVHYAVVIESAYYAADYLSHNRIGRYWFAPGFDQSSLVETLRSHLASGYDTFRLEREKTDGHW